MGHLGHGLGIGSPVETRWSHKAKCLAASQIIGARILDVRTVDQDRALIGDPPAVAGADPHAEKLARCFETLTALKTRLAQVYETTQSEPLREWITQFDAFMRDLDALRSPEFTREFLTHIGSTPATDHEATDAEIRQLLRDLVRSMPLNALLLEHKDLLRTALGFDDYHEDRIVLTLDGGGIRGLMTLVMLVAIRDLLRKKSGIADLRIDDVFDLAIGTSTGGVIVGCMVVARMELEDISKLYTQFGRVVFSDQNKTDLKQSVAARYGDARMLEILTKLFSNKRLDDPGIAFASSNERGPAGIRFGFTTCDISRSHLRVLLLRNYDGPPELGTQHCYVSESVRATATPPLVIHPYARFYPLLEIHFTDWSMRRPRRGTRSGRTRSIS